jgi:hypothetical protein
MLLGFTSRGWRKWHLQLLHGPHHSPRKRRRASRRTHTNGPSNSCRKHGRLCYPTFMHENAPTFAPATRSVAARTHRPSHVTAPKRLKPPARHLISLYQIRTLQSIIALIISNGPPPQTLQATEQPDGRSYQQNECKDGFRGSADCSKQWHHARCYQAEAARGVGRDTRGD